MSGIIGNNLGRASGLIKSGGVGADAVDSANIADDAIDSEHYTNASIDNAHLADNAVDTAEIADNAVTLAKMAGGTDGNIISFDASGDPVAIATGSDGEVLTSTGAGSPPAFEAAAGGGGMTFLSKQTGTSSGGVGFNEVFNGTYKGYMFYGVFGTASNAQGMTIRFKDGSSELNDSNYDYQHFQARATGDTTSDLSYANQGVDQTLMIMFHDQFASTASRFQFILHVPDPQQSQHAYNSLNMTFRVHDNSNRECTGFAGGSYRVSTTAVDGLHFGTTGGNIGGYHINLYGLNES